MNFFQHELLGVVGIAPVHAACPDVLVELMPHPFHHDLAQDPAFLYPCDEGIAQLMDVPFGEDTLQYRLSADHL